MCYVCNKDTVPNIRKALPNYSKLIYIDTTFHPKNINSEVITKIKTYQNSSPPSSRVIK